MAFDAKFWEERDREIRAERAARREAASQRAIAQREDFLNSKKTFYFGLAEGTVRKPIAVYCVLSPEKIPETAFVSYEETLTRAEVEERLPNLISNWANEPNLSKEQQIDRAYRAACSDGSIKINVYYFGHYLVSEGKWAVYCTRKSGKIPETAFRRFEELLSSSDVAIKVAQLQEEANAQNAQSPKQKAIQIPEAQQVATLKLEAGHVVYCSDSDKTHTAIVLEVEEEHCKVLYLTSNPHWNKYSRPASKEEVALCGMPQKAATYLAPVRIHKKYVFLSGITYPSFRTESLIEEFLHTSFAGLMFGVMVS